MRTPSLIDLLRNTLKHLEATADVNLDDPAFIHFKNHLVQAIAELQLLKDAAGSSSNHSIAA